MTEDASGLEEAFEKVLVRYHIPTYLVYDGIGKVVADRGDLVSSLVDKARQVLLGVAPDSF